jgi:hypothetical protein
MFSKKIISIAIYLIAVILLFTIKPNIMFKSDGEMKNFGYFINKETTIIPVVLFLPLFALILFIFTLIIESIYV